MTVHINNIQTSHPSWGSSYLPPDPVGYSLALMSPFFPVVFTALSAPGALELQRSAAALRCVCPTHL